MTRLYSRFWINVTLLLSVVFAVVFFPVFRERFGFAWSTLLTALGVMVIWAVYFIRAYIFTRGDSGVIRSTWNRKVSSFIRLSFFLVCDNMSGSPGS